MRKGKVFFEEVILGGIIGGVFFSLLYLVLNTFENQYRLPIKNVVNTIFDSPFNTIIFFLSILFVPILIISLKNYFTLSTYQVILVLIELLLLFILVILLRISIVNGGLFFKKFDKEKIGIIIAKPIDLVAHPINGDYPRIISESFLESKIKTNLAKTTTLHKLDFPFEIRSVKKEFKEIGEARAFLKKFNADFILWGTVSDRNNQYSTCFNITFESNKSHFEDMTDIYNIFSISSKGDVNLSRNTDVSFSGRIENNEDEDFYLQLITNIILAWVYKDHAEYEIFDIFQSKIQNLTCTKKKREIGQTIIELAKNGNFGFDCYTDYDSICSGRAVRFLRTFIDSVFDYSRLNILDPDLEKRLTVIKLERIRDEFSPLGIHSYFYDDNSIFMDYYSQDWDQNRIENSHYFKLLDELKEKDTLLYQVQKQMFYNKYFNMNHIDTVVSSIMNEYYSLKKQYPDYFPIYENAIVSLSYQLRNLAKIKKVIQNYQERKKQIISFQYIVRDSSDNYRRDSSLVDSSFVKNLSNLDIGKHEYIIYKNLFEVSLDMMKLNHDQIKMFYYLNLILSKSKGLENEKINYSFQRFYKKIIDQLSNHFDIELNLKDVDRTDTLLLLQSHLLDLGLAKAKRFNLLDVAYKLKTEKILNHLELTFASPNEIKNAFFHTYEHASSLAEKENILCKFAEFGLSGNKIHKNPLFLDQLIQAFEKRILEIPNSGDLYNYLAYLYEGKLSQALYANYEEKDSSEIKKYSSLINELVYKAYKIDRIYELQHLEFLMKLNIYDENNLEKEDNDDQKPIKGYINTKHDH